MHEAIFEHYKGSERQMDRQDRGRGEMLTNNLVPFRLIMPAGHHRRLFVHMGLHCRIRRLWTTNHSTHMCLCLEKSFPYLFSLFVLIIIFIHLGSGVPLWSFSYKTITEIRYWCLMRRSGVQSAFQFIPKVLHCVLCANSLDVMARCPHTFNHIVYAQTRKIVGLCTVCEGFNIYLQHIPT